MRMKGRSQSCIKWRGGWRRSGSNGRVAKSAGVGGGGKGWGWRVKVVGAEGGDVVTLPAHKHVTRQQHVGATQAGERKGAL